MTTSQKNKVPRHRSKRSATTGRDSANGFRISAPEAERQGLYPDWPTWPLGPSLNGNWEWLLHQVQTGTLPDVPCRWVERLTPGRALVYWLDVEARTRHVVVGYGHLLLTSPTGDCHERRAQLH